MMIKVHKIDKNCNWKTRRVTGACGSIIIELYRWVNCRTVPTHIKDSKSLLDLLIKLGNTSPGSRLFLTDAVVMRANTSTEHVLEVIT